MTFRPSTTLVLTMALALLGGLMPLHSEVAIVESPHTSLSKTRKLLDAIDLRVMLNLDFQHAVDLGERGELRHRHGVIESRLYARDQRGRMTWVEVAIIAGAHETARGSREVVRLHDSGCGL